MNEERTEGIAGLLAEAREATDRARLYDDEAFALRRRLIAREDEYDARLGAAGDLPPTPTAESAWVAIGLLQAELGLESERRRLVELEAGSLRANVLAGTKHLGALLEMIRREPDRDDPWGLFRGEPE